MNRKIDERALRIFETVVARPEKEWSALIEELCGSNLMLADDVRRLMRADLEHGDAIEKIRFEVVELVDDHHHIPARIGRYQIEDEIGRGGMGVVYRARQDSPHRHVAVKLVYMGLAGANIRQRFLNEVESHGRLDHPGIARIYDASIVKTNGVEQPYIAMELIEGVPLGRYVAEQAPDLKEKLRLLIEICRIVEYAHRRGVIHRDLKPANILIEHRDGKAEPRVLDFGVSRLLKADAAHSFITQPGQIVGTLAYSSPEQLSGDSTEIDTSTDTYSLAAVGFEMITGELPIDVRHDTIATALHRIRDEEPKCLRTSERALDRDLDAIFAKALEKSKERRYASVVDFSDDLERFLNDEPIKARQRTTWYIAKKFARRRKGLVIAVCLTCLLFVAGTVGTIYGLYESRIRLHEQVALSVELVSELVKLQRVTGTSEVRKTTLENLRYRVELLLDELPTHQSLRQSYAEILESISAIQLEASRSEESLALRRQALPIREALANEIGDVDSLRRLAKCQVLVGDCHRQMDRIDEAKAKYLEAFEIQRRALELDPNHAGAYDDLLWSYSRIANILLVKEYHNNTNDRSSDALIWAAEGYVKALEFLDAAPDNLYRQHAALGFEAVLCSIYLARDDADRLLTVSTTRRERAEAVAKRDPDNRWIQYERIAALNCAAEANQRKADYEAAIALQSESLRLGRAQLAKADSYDVVAIGVQNALVKLARWKMRIGQCEAAMDDIAEACRVLGDSVGPTSLRFHNQVRCLMSAVKLAATCGQVEDCRQYHQAATAAALAYINAQPDHWRPYFTVARLYQDDVLPGSRNLVAAHDAILQAKSRSPTLFREVEELQMQIEKQLNLRKAN